MEEAEYIANLILDKSYLGNEWFAFLSIVLVGLFSAGCAFVGSYLTTRAQNNAVRADFKKALENLEIQTKAIKGIEEGIAHDFIEKRELNKVLRDKIESLYLALQEDLEIMSHNLYVATNDARQDVKFPNNSVEMTASLYFKSELAKEMEFYRQQRMSITGRIRAMTHENLERVTFDLNTRMAKNESFFKNYNQGKVNIELALEELMKNLTKQ